MNKPPVGTIFGRALKLRCIRCGEAKMFRSLTRMNESCAQCGFKYERSPGYFLGSMYINYGLTAILMTLSYVIVHLGYGVSNRDMLPYLIGFCVLFPLFFFRYSRALWLAMDSCFDSEEMWD